MNNEESPVTVSDVMQVLGGKLEGKLPKEALILEMFCQGRLNAPCVQQWVKVRNGKKYLPVSALESIMDAIFFGMWSTCNDSYQIVANEIGYIITVKFKHPFSGEWLERSGAGACQIRQISGASPTDVDKKIKNALEMDLAHARANAFKNAVKSIGRFFGRDLSRKDEDVRPDYGQIDKIKSKAEAAKLAITAAKEKGAA